MVRKRCYAVGDRDDECYVALVATSVKEAKKIAFQNTEDCNLHGVEWIEMRVWWLKDIDVEHFEVGTILDGATGLALGAYHFAEDYCPNCNKWENLYFENGAVGCRACCDAHREYISGGKR